MSDTMRENVAAFGRGTAFFNNGFNGPIVDTLVRTAESFGKTCFAWQEEVFRFASARLQRDTELGQALVNTRNWADAAKLQQEWASSTIRDYTSEATRLLEIATQAQSDIMHASADIAPAATQRATEAAEPVMRRAQDEARAAKRGPRSVIPPAATD